MAKPPLPQEPHLRPRTEWSARRLLLWVILVVFFVVMFQSFGRHPDTESTEEASAPSTARTSEGSLLMSWLPLLVMVGLFGVFVFRQRRGQRSVAANDLGVLHLAVGDYEAAVRCFDETARTGAELTRAVAIYNLGLTRLRMGEVARAQELLRSAQSELLRGHALGFAGLPNHEATCHALRGDIATARQLLEEGLRRKGSLPYNDSLLPEVLVLCRAEHYGAAVKAVDSRWREAEAAGAFHMKLLRVLKAFALNQLDPEANEAEIHDALAGAQPLRGPELRGLFSEWTQLRDFLAARDVAGAAA